MMTIQKIFHAYFGNTKMTTAQKVLPIALSLVALATVGTAPALARTIHQPATQDSQQMYMYTGPDAAWSWPDGFFVPA
jgi:hypothetical protein